MELLLIVLLGFSAFLAVFLMKRRRKTSITASDPLPRACHSNLTASENGKSPNLSSGLQQLTNSSSETSVHNGVHNGNLLHESGIPQPASRRPKRRTNVLSDESSSPPAINTRTGSKSNVAPDFPFLRISNLVKGGTPDTFLPNTRESIKFDSDTCSGEMIVMLRTNPIDPAFLWAFEKKKRYFDLHFRLTFKVEPRGVVYLGGELPKKMTLGLATDLACKGILAVVRRLSSTLHASFGDEAGDELPHICFPLWHAADRLIITKPGLPLPDIGRGQIAENDISRGQRLKDSGLGRGVIRKGDTVTFSFHSAYMDLVEWKVRSLGAIRDQNLSLFWGTQPLRVVVYDVENASTKKHLHSMLRYFLCFELKNSWYERREDDECVVFNLDRNTQRDGSETTDDDDDEDEEDERTGEGDEVDGGEETEQSSRTRFMLPGSSPSKESIASSPISSFSSPSISKTLSAKAAMVFRPKRILSAILGKRSGKSGLMLSPPTSPRGSSLGNLVASNKLYPLVPPSSVPSPTNSSAAGKEPAWLASPKEVDLRVPLWIRLRGKHKNQPQQTCFVLLATSSDATNHSQVEERIMCKDFDQMCKLFPAASWRAKALSLIPSSGSTSQAAATFARQCEMRRRMFDEEAMRLQSLPIGMSPTDDMVDLFSEVPRPLIASRRFIGPRVGNIVFESLVLREVFESHWQEEWLVLLKAHGSNALFALFFLHKRAPVRIIPAASMLSVSFFESNGDSAVSSLSPLFKRFPALNVETLSKNKLLCFPSHEIRAKAFETLTSSGGVGNDKDLVRSNDPRTSQEDDIRMAGEQQSIPSAFSFALDTDAVILEETYRWGSKKRVILNSRQSAFCSKVLNASKEDPCEYMKNLLRMAIDLTLNRDAQIAFFNEASRLKTFDLLSWASSQTLETNSAFFLNLYHVILIHARHMVGPPMSQQSYDSFAMQMSYEFGSLTRTNACVLSIAEIENRILRPYQSAQPGQAAVEKRAIPPCTPFTVALSLKRIDPRITFALNRLTESCLSSVPIFSPSTLDAELDAVARAYLDEFLLVEGKSRRIKVPRVLEWFSSEFQMEEISPKCSVGVVSRWLSPEKLSQLSSLVRAGDGSWAGMHGSTSDLFGTSLESDIQQQYTSAGAIKFEFRKFHWQPRVRVTVFEA